MTAPDVRFGINAVLTPYTLTQHLRVPLYLNQAETVTHALLDSGAMGNFIHEELVSQLGLVRTPRTPMPLMDVKGLKIGEIGFQVKVTIQMGAHEEDIILDVANIGAHRLILGLPWLQVHNPEIQWSSGRIQFVSQYCNANCFTQPNDVFAKQTPIYLNATDVVIPVMHCHPDAKIPTRGLIESAGWDLYSIQDTRILPGHHALISTGISLQTPPGHYGRIAPQSGLALKQGITVGVGVIDRDYTGEVRVLLFNQGNTEVTVAKHDRIAQLIPEAYSNCPLKEVDQIEDTKRGSAGFGSTDNPPMDPELTEIYSVELAGLSTEMERREKLPQEYHRYLHLTDPEAPLAELPPLRPGYDFEIKLDKIKPLPKPAWPYRMNLGEEADWEKWRDIMLNARHISPAPPNTPIAAPCFFIWKKNGTRRLVIDYRKLNDITIKDSFPLPRIDTILEHMQGSKVFSKFDLKNGYNLL